MVASIYIFIILISIISAVLAIQIAEESVLILRVKSWLGLVQPYPKHIKTLGKFKSWRRMLGTAFYFVMPFVLFCVVLQRLHYLLSEILSCSICTSFHIEWILLYFVLAIPLNYCILLAPLAIPCVYVLNRIR